MISIVIDHHSNQRLLIIFLIGDLSIFYLVLLSSSAPASTYNLTSTPTSVFLFSYLTFRLICTLFNYISTNPITLSLVSSIDLVVHTFSFSNNYYSMKFTLNLFKNLSPTFSKKWTLKFLTGTLRWMEDDKISYNSYSLERLILLSISSIIM